MNKYYDQYHEVLIDYITNITNRSINQTKFLLELCNYDYSRLCLLEEQIANNFIHYCPSDKIEIDKILNMKSKLNILKFDKLKNSHNIKINRKWRL
jgi:hypothetical protein